MKFALAIAAVLVAQPAFAKSWADTSCAIGFVSEGEAFTYLRDGKEDVRCEIQSWPISSAEALMSCSDGSSPKLVVVSDTAIILDGIELQEVTDDGPVCD